MIVFGWIKFAGIVPVGSLQGDCARGVASGGFCSIAAVDEGDEF